MRRCCCSIFKFAFRINVICCIGDVLYFAVTAHRRPPQQIQGQHVQGRMKKGYVTIRIQKILIKKMTGFYEAAAQQTTGNLQDILTASSHSARFAYSALLADCRYDAGLPEMRQRTLFLVGSWMSMTLHVFERIGVMGQVVSITINRGSC